MFNIEDELCIWLVYFVIIDLEVIFAAEKLWNQKRFETKQTAFFRIRFLCAWKVNALKDQNHKEFLFNYIIGRSKMMQNFLPNRIKRNNNHVTIGTSRRQVSESTQKKKSKAKKFQKKKKKPKIKILILVVCSMTKFHELKRQLESVTCSFNEKFFWVNNAVK